MKKIMWLILIFAGMVYSQTTGVVVGNGAVWTDSLGYTNKAETKDSVWILQTNFAYTKYRFFLDGNANSTVDSLGIQLGSIIYNEAKTPVDTVWGSYTGVKIPAGTVVVRMVNTSSGADFLLEDSAFQLIKFSLLNYRLANPTRNVLLTVNAK